MVVRDKTKQVANRSCDVSQVSICLSDKSMALEIFVPRRGVRIIVPCGGRFVREGAIQKIPFSGLLQESWESVRKVI
jgi:hypothetical protein